MMQSAHNKNPKLAMGEGLGRGGEGEGVMGRSASGERPTEKGKRKTSEAMPSGETADFRLSFRGKGRGDEGKGEGGACTPTQSERRAIIK